MVAGVCAVLVLVPWGLPRPRGFADAPARVLTLLGLVAFAWVMAPGLRFRVRVKREVKSQLLTGFAGIGLGALLFWGASYLDHRDGADALQVDAAVARWIGVGLCALGFGAQAWAVVTLGRFYSQRVAILENHQLVDSGPYRLVRHPAYTGLVCWVAGFPLAFGFWIGLVIAAAMLPSLLRRIRLEEGLLEAEFGGRYDAVRSRTGRLVPKVF